MNKPIINHTFETSDKDTLKEKLMQMPELEIEPPKENRFVADPNGEIDFTEKDIAQMTEQEKFMNGLIDKHGNPTREELEKEFMKMPEIESVEIHQDRPDEFHYDLPIESSMVYKDKFCLGGTNEEGEFMTIWYDSHEFLKCVDKERLKEIKSKLIKTIKEIK